MKINLKKGKLKAFTLVEIMIVLSIIAILGGITISNDYKANKIRNSLLVDTEAIATDVRDMQNRTTSFVQNPMFNNVGYGIFFDIRNPLKAETFYKLDGDFDVSELSGSNNQKPSDDFIFTVGNSIKRICLNGCSTKVVDSNGKLALYFIKPRPYTNFSYSDDGLTYHSSLYPSGNSISHACIEIGAEGSSDIRRIDVYYIGQISFALGACEN